MPSVDYMYSFDPDWQRDWQWSEKYATQPEILRYLNHVADKHDLRRHITFSTRVQQARWDDDASLWHVRTDVGDEVTSRFVVMATGCLSMPKQAEIDGLERFAGEVYFTSRWPHEPIDFTGQAGGGDRHGFLWRSIDSGHRPGSATAGGVSAHPEFLDPGAQWPVAAGEARATRRMRRNTARRRRVSPAGIPMERSIIPTFSVSETERQQRYERAWEGGLLFESINTFRRRAEQSRSQPRVRRVLPEQDPLHRRRPGDGGRSVPDRSPLRDEKAVPGHELLRHLQPAARAPGQRPKTSDPTRHRNRASTPPTSQFTFDAIVFATGFDAVTGAITAVDIRGRNGLALKDKWANGPQTYLGLTTVGFPNLFFITGPGSPSVLSNMVVSIEQHVDWVLDCLGHLNASGFDVIEPTETAEAGWTQHVNDCADITLYPAANSWYMGANVPGKPRVFLPYCAGFDFYRASCDEVVARDYLGFRLSGPDGSQCNDGVVRRLQPDVEMVLNEVAALTTAADGIDARSGRPRLVHADVDGSTAGTGRRRDRRRCAARRRRRFGVPAVPAADPGPAPDRRVLPWRRLRAG